MPLVCLGVTQAEVRGGSASIGQADYWWYRVRGSLLHTVLHPYGAGAADVLDVGSADGPSVSWLRGDRMHITLDVDPRGLVPGTGVCGSALQLPFADESFDNVVTTLSLCSVGDLDVALAEIRRVLRPGGALHFLEHVRGEGATARWQDRLTPIQRRIADGCHLNRDTAAAILQAGFEITELERFAMPAGASVIRPAIQGTALRPGTAAP